MGTNNSKEEEKAVTAATRKKGVKGVITLCGHDGDDAPKYLEKQVLKAIN